ncbi:hypothetical protein CN307_23970 [Bacillus cereus]|uniref:Uncharacterized protein n=1 Tax=Bacillus cereus TaxID=1396 RepID=A0A2A8ZVU8_BACCE|nr:hypothetical protein CN307_23970 [Bacillus cereus]
MHKSCKKKALLQGPFFIYPALTDSKTSTSKFNESKEIRWGSTVRKSPIGSTNNHLGMNPQMIKVSLYIQYYPPPRKKILSNRKRKRCC